MNRAEHWGEALRREWAIDARLQQLDGEYDLNFRVEAADARRFVLKVMRPDCERWLVDIQVGALRHIRESDPSLPLPGAVPALSGVDVLELPDETGAKRLVWLLEFLPGRTYAAFQPHSVPLIRDLGEKIGAMDRALKDFSHPALDRDFKWDLTRAGWIRDHLDAVVAQRRELLVDIIAGFDAARPALDALPRVAIHNDINDHNLLVERSPDGTARISGILDLGDMCVAPRICELAIAGAYVVLDHPEPETALAALVSGYHQTESLTAAEIDLVWPLLKARLAVSVVNSALMAAEKPDDPYVVISEAPAWRFLETASGIDAGLVRTRLRVACGLPVTDMAQRIRQFLDAKRGSFAAIVDEDLANAPLVSLSAENSAVPQDPFAMTAREAAELGRDQGHRIWLGYYGEPRLIYTDAAFRNGPWKASAWRRIHLGIDVFAPAGTRISAPMAATVHAVENRAGHLDYGGLVILRHETPSGDPFFSLYGHLDPQICQSLNPGQDLRHGEPFAALGDQDCNGGWAPHLHLQLAMTIDGMAENWPGVADPDAFELWSAICPNPAALLNLPDDKTVYEPANKQSVLEQRHRHFASNLSLSYDEPVMFVRGWRHHLFDQWGRAYLDAYNNVPHVGHAHPRVQEVAAEQLKRINTNTRYLHPAQTAFADKILSKLPEPLTVCFFVNSGTEANELALRLARGHTGGKHMITPDHGYHGNTTGAIDISAYKFNAKGGPGQPDWVELVEVADDYRGSHRRDDPDRAARYAALVDTALQSIKRKNGKLAGFIAETFPSVGGQIIPPPGYLRQVYEKVRAAGGVCIADEVQTGLGRLGHHYFGFEHQDAVPDIVVLGKPIGNGHPIGVVVTTPDIAASFAEGPEFFSTFGGSTLSCVIGCEVLQIVDDEGLMPNARVMGDRLIAGLAELQERHAIIGDVRGMGLFVGVDLVSDRDSRAPATRDADYVKNRLRQRRILIGTEGPHDNILKIRPPLTIEADDIDMLLTVLDETLGELG